MQSTRENDGLWQFFALTFIISLSAWGLLIVLGIPGGSTDPSAPPPSAVGLLLLVLGGFAPSIAGFAMARRYEGVSGPRTLWRRAGQFSLGWKPYAVILSLPLLIIAARFALYV